MPQQIDQLYAAPSDLIEGFCFDERVVNVFPDMIRRSVPGYSTILHMIEQITERYAQHETYCYDLGCSLGAATLALKKGVGQRSCRVIGIDNSPEMIVQCKKLLADKTQDIGLIDIRQDDIRDMTFAPCSVVVLNFTLQFLPIAARGELLKKIASALVTGGVLILSEKLAFDDPKHHELMIELHHNFKRSQGYSQLEIAQKRQALENVLIPESFNSHQKRLIDSGFSSIDLWFQCFNFASMIAFK